MKNAIAGFAISLAVAVGPVAAQTVDPNKDPNQRVCKREKKVNSRFTTEICHTRAEWIEIAEAAKRDYAEQRDRPVIDGRRSE